jgi:hypothetical protein
MRELAIECVIERVGESVRELDIESVTELEVPSQIPSGTARVTAQEQLSPLLARLTTVQPDGPESYFIVAATFQDSRLGAKVHEPSPNGPSDAARAT